MSLSPKTVRALPSATNIQGTDIVYLMQDPDGAAADAKATADAIAARALTLPGFADAVDAALPAAPSLPAAVDAALATAPSLPDLIDARLPAPALPMIESFAPGLVGDGVTDDSVAFLAAHDAAYAAGVREVLVTNQHFIPTARDIGQVIYRGPGRIISDGLARVIPMAAPSEFPPLLQDTIPSVHLPKLAAASSPVVCFVGDSRATTGANFVGPLSNSYRILQEAFRRANPGKTFTFVNRAISGQSWGSFASTSTTDPNSTGHPDWTWTAGQSWATQVQNVQADVVVFAFGMNGTSAPVDIANPLAVVCAGAKVPDILFVTSGGASTGTNFTGQRQRLANAGFVRSMVRSVNANFNIANMPPAGLIDYGRLWWRARYGVDPCRQQMRRVVSDPVFVAQNTPYTLPLSWGDVDMTFTMDATGGNPDITLTTDAGINSGGWSLVRIDRSSNNARAAMILNNGGQNRFSTGGSTPTMTSTGTWTFRITLVGSWLRVTYSTGGTPTILFDGPVTRYADTPFAMTLNTGFSLGLTITSLSVGEPQTCLQTFTEAEMWGTDPNGANAAAPWGGNASNHETSIALTALMAPAFAGTNLSA